VIRRGCVIRKGYRSEGDFELNMRLANVRICWIDCEKLVLLAGSDSKVPKGSWIVAEYKEASQILNLKNQGKVTLLARARVF
jgi:hypothetical protein